MIYGVPIVMKPENNNSRLFKRKSNIITIDDDPQQKDVEILSSRNPV